MVGKIYANRVDLDEKFFVKAIVNVNNNYLHDKAREDKEGLFTKFYFAISLVLTMLSAFFIDYLGYVSILLLVILLAIFLAIAIDRYRKRRKIFWQNREEMKKNFESLGLPWKD